MDADLLRVLEAMPDDALVPVRWLRARLKAPAPAEPVGDLSCADVARALGRTPGTVRGWCASGALAGAYRLNGREWRVPRAALRAYLDAHVARRKPDADAAPVDLGTWRHKKGA